MIPIRIDGPAVEPVSVAEARDLLRLDDGAQDALVAALVRAARAAVEDATRRVLAESRWRLTLAAWPARPVPVSLAPVRSVAAAFLVAADGGATPLAAGLVRLDPLAADPPRLLLGPAPAEAAGRSLAVELIAGDPPDSVPAPLVQAVRLLVAHWFENRGDEASPAGSTLPGPVLALLAPYRRARL